MLGAMRARVAFAPYQMTMSTRARASLAGVAAVFYLAHTLWLWVIFPGDILGAFFMTPVHLAIAAGIGTGAFFGLKWARTWRRVAIAAACLLVGTVLAGLVIFPAPQYEPGPFGQIAQYHSVFGGYPNNVQFQDIFYGNRAERAAARAKYASPDTVIVIVFERWTEQEVKCWIGLRDGTISSYDANELSISDDGGDTLVFVTDPLDPTERREYMVSRADIREVAEGQGSLGREHYSIYYPDPGRDGILVRTTGDAMFEWVLRTFK